MAKYTTRIELYGSPSRTDYDNLHAAMEREGFTRTISWEGETVTYQMPHAEYNRTSDLAAAQIKDSAVIAAKTVWSDFGVLVTQSQGGREKYNLKKV